MHFKNDIFLIIYAYLNLLINSGNKKQYIGRRSKPKGNKITPKNRSENITYSFNNIGHSEPSQQEQ